MAKARAAVGGRQNQTYGALNWPLGSHQLFQNCPMRQTRNTLLHDTYDVCGYDVSGLWILRAQHRSPLRGEIRSQLPIQKGAILPYSAETLRSAETRILLARCGASHSSLPPTRRTTMPGVFRSFSNIVQKSPKSRSLRWGLTSAKSIQYQ